MADTRLENRLQRLEDLEAIRTLKGRYFACCDAKDPDGVRACFADGPVEIEYGPIGSFDNADALVAVYTDIACHPHMVEMHHGVNPQLEWLDPENARGEWDVQYQLINTREMTLTQFGGHYYDRYGRTAEGWKIRATRFEVTSTLVIELGETALKRLLAGNRPPDTGAEAAG